MPEPTGARTAPPVTVDLSLIEVAVADLVADILRQAPHLDGFTLTRGPLRLTVRKGADGHVAAADLSDAALEAAYGRESGFAVFDDPEG